MATISIDVAGVLQEIRIAIQTIKGAKALDRKAKQDARRTVYQALSLHPALDHMQPPERHLNDADWYLARVEARSSKAKALLGSRTKNPDKRQHFKSAARLGPVGTRARIMMLLLWLLGHRLTRDKQTQLVSTAISQGLTSRSHNEGDLIELLTLDYVQAVIQDLSQMIGEKLPIDASLDPFGLHYTPSKIRDEDRLDVFDVPSMPSNWKRYDWDIKTNPTLLLEHSTKKIVIIPETRLSLLLLRYVAQIYGLGRIINSDGVNEDAFWNAGLPFDNTQDGLVQRRIECPNYTQYIPQNLQLPSTSESLPTALQLVQSAASVQIKNEMSRIISALSSHPIQDYIHLDSTVDKILPESRNSEVSHIRTAIMISFLQVIGQGLTNDQQLNLLSAAVSRGAGPDAPEYLGNKLQLILNYFKRMPPFGTDIICNLCRCTQEEEDDPAPPVAPYTLSSDTQLLYWDVKRDLTFLLELKLLASGRQIVVPHTKLSLHILCNVAHIFDLGNLLDSCAEKGERFCTSTAFLQNDKVTLLQPDTGLMRAQAGDQRKQAEELRQQAFNLSNQSKSLRKRANNLDQQATTLIRRADGLCHASTSLEGLLTICGQI